MFLGFLQCPDTLPEEETRRGFRMERYGILRTGLASGGVGRTEVYTLGTEVQGCSRRP